MKLIVDNFKILLSFILHVQLTQKLHAYNFGLYQRYVRNEGPFSSGCEAFSSHCRSLKLMTLLPKLRPIWCILFNHHTNQLSSTAKHYERRCYDATECIENMSWRDHYRGTIRICPARHVYVLGSIKNAKMQDLPAHATLLAKIKTWLVQISQAPNKWQHGNATKKKCTQRWSSKYHWVEYDFKD